MPGSAGFVGEDHPEAKLTERDVREIKDRIGDDSLAEIARDYSVSKQAIFHISSGRSWSHV